MSTINTNDTNYQKSKIIVEETRRLYFQIILLFGIFLFVVIRFFMIKNTISQNFPLFMQYAYVGGNISAYSPEIAITQSPFFIFIYFGVIFSIFLVYKYIRLYNLKRKFKNELNGDKSLKKYMKTDKIPNKEDIKNKFDEDKTKSKKRFYLLILRVTILNIVLYYVFTNYIDSSFLFFNIILPFSILTLIYRYLLLFHVDKKFLGKDWEDKKIENYMDMFDLKNN